ncbi:MAG: molybdate ABC transporter substrate-binding protein [Mariprofundaceae bacterium]|nr:molybdate ABC transporter substrate-binding protein [Mariprofundaceae bacterium]
MKVILIVLAASIVQFAPCKVWAGEALTVAVAANFYRPMQEIASAYEKQSGNRVRLVSGSTGKLYAQIIQGAPYQIFFAADSRRPALLESQGLIQPGSRFTYATGALVLWSMRDDLDLKARGMKTLLDKRVKHIAIANPKTAPYGHAAMQALKAAGMDRMVRAKLVYGENIGQVFLFVRSGNADVGLVAASSTYQAGGRISVAPSDSYDPIVQQAVVLRHAPETARRFTAFLSSETARKVLRKYGYGVSQ